MTEFARYVEQELKQARHEHPKPMNSLHEGFAVLLEEVEEFKAEVFKKEAKRDRDRLLWELVQVGAMAQRIAEELL